MAVLLNSENRVGLRNGCVKHDPVRNISVFGILSSFSALSFQSVHQINIVVVKLALGFLLRDLLTAQCNIATNNRFGKLVCMNL